MPWIKKTFNLTRERRTYILGEFKGKYYGELDEEKIDFSVEQYYDFTLYEGTITVDAMEKLRKESDGPFTGFRQVDKFPGKLPDPLPCEISFLSSKETYKLDIHDLRFEKGSIQIVDHQQDDHEVFGTLKAIATGYIRDDVEYTEERAVWEDDILPPDFEPVHSDPKPDLISDNSSVGPDVYRPGKPHRSGGYAYSHKTTVQEGCSTALLQLLGIILLVIFLIAMGPVGLILLAIGVIVYLLSFVGPKTAEWIGRIFSFLFLAFYVFAIVYGISSGSRGNSARTSSASRSYRMSRNDQRETSGQSTVRTNYVNPDQTLSDDTRLREEPQVVDTIISHHRIWRDYKGRQYEGDIKVLLSAYREASLRRLYFNPSAGQLTRQYDQLLYSLSIQDRYSLPYVYELYDSIGKANKLNRLDFAEMIVSCVQDIPYTLVLNDGCDPRLYNDNFIRRYLSDGNSCDGNVKFGLYSPVEFMGNMKGDCDTRTLLLFTILSHYNYEVAVLSSEFYKHSLLAINLPYAGAYKDVLGKHYYTWETTFMNFTPGQLPAEVANMDFWRISLINQKTKTQND
jgi:hypothetical protein